MFLLRDDVYINGSGDGRVTVPHQFTHHLCVAAFGEQHTGKGMPQAVNPFCRHPTGPADIPEGSVNRSHANGGMRQPVFKGLREDKAPQECVEKE